VSITKKKLADLRKLMSKQKLEAYYVPSTDPHQSEYVPACWQRRSWLSGFTGSAGDLIVTQHTAGLWTDGRYFLQAQAELKGSGIKLFKMGIKGVPTPSAWLGATLKKGQTLGVDPQLLSLATIRELRTALELVGAKLKLVEDNLVDYIWEDRPYPSRAPIEAMPRSVTGETVTSKLRRLRQVMAKHHADALVVTTLDAIAWLFNIRSQDVEYNPFVIAYAIVTPKNAVLFTHKEKVTNPLRKALLSAAVQIRPYEAMSTELVRLAKQRKRTWVDGRTVNCWVLQKLGGCQLITDPSPINLMKAKKNATEIEGMKAAHLRDGMAMVKFFAWLDQHVPRGEVSEIGVAEKLSELRAESDQYHGESFATIAGYGAHGAIVHYKATPVSNAILRPEGLFLIDSGAQYLDGTTDITRTVLLGNEATPEQKDRFTRVLKGHIAIARCRFPVGTAGRQIDALARQSLWNVGLDYAHGTGHGVGAYLSVHEGPQSIHPLRCTGVPLEEGNILSDEPGFYKEGEYGIRIENLVLVSKDEELSRDESTFLKFEPITLCPIDVRLIDTGLLNEEEREWLNRYHQKVREALIPQLSGIEANWLERATPPI
jgi:Xaa-Pro aminopeptidase